MPNASTMTNSERRIARHVRSNRMVKVCLSLLVPLMIGVFTIVTMVIQMNIAQQQREQDLRISKENREKDFEIANQTRLQQYEIENARRRQDYEIANQTRMLQDEFEEKRRATEIKVREDQQKNTVLAAYLKDMAVLMLTTNFTLSNIAMATVVRAKTLTTLVQLDSKRKLYLIRFLYEGQMLTVGQAVVDLTDADLSEMDFSNSKLHYRSFAKCNLSTSRFVRAELMHASFEEALLGETDFYQANLTDTSFYRAQLRNTNLQSTTVTRTNFTCVDSRHDKFLGWNITGSNTIFNEAIMPYAFITNAHLINASFVKTQLSVSDMRWAILKNTNFTGADLSFTAFDHSDLSGSIFDQSIVTGATFSHTNLVGTQWQNTETIGADFSGANLRFAMITDYQIRRAWKTSNTILPDGSRGSNTNLLKNGDAEGSTGVCETSPWHVKSIIATAYGYTLWTVLGLCHFTKQSNITQAKMSQRVQVPNEYSEWIRTNVAMIRMQGICICNTGLAIHVRQFNGDRNLSLVNNTLDPTIFQGEPTEVLLPCHPATTEVELEIIFTGECNPWGRSGSCDNLKLDIWHRDYTLSH